MTRTSPSGRSRLSAGSALAVALLALTGCGDGSLKVVPVSGVVTIDGQPLTYGHIQVLPANSRPASGRIGPDGRFTLTTTAANDGCVVGTHPVVILAGESLSPVATKWHAPKKYADSKTSDLTITVSKATDDVKIVLTWGGGKPFTEQAQKEGGTEFDGMKK